MKFSEKEIIEMKILVTGATGNVGSYVVNELLKMNEDVVAAVIDLEEARLKLDSKVELVEFDFTNQNTFDKALQGIDRVFLMRPPHLGKPEDLYPFIDKMKEKGIELVVFLSLMGVEKNTIPPHHKIEKYIEAKEISFCHIRPGFFMQNISGVHSVEIREDSKIFIPAGKSKTSFIDAADIGLAIATVLHDAKKHHNTSYTITGKEALDYYEVAQKLSKITNRKITYAKPSFLRYRSYYINKRKLDKTYVNVTVALYFMTRMGTAKDVTDTFYTLTGKQPNSFDEFAIANIKAFVKNYSIL